jgi:hypothetical protein
MKVGILSTSFASHAWIPGDVAVRIAVEREVGGNALAAHICRFGYSSGYRISINGDRLLLPKRVRLDVFLCG